MIAKAGLGLVGLGAIGIGGVAFTKPEWLGINKEITWTPLAEDHNFKTNGSSSPYNGKFGETHKNYLVGVVGKEANKDGNKRWWDKAFEMLKDANVSQGMFAATGTSNQIKVNDGYSPTEQATGPKALNRVCEEAYKKGESDFHKASDSDDGTKFKKEDVWKYCSPVGQEPKTISTNGSNDEKQADKIGKAKESELISVLYDGNKVFWEIRDKEFKAKEESFYGSSKFFQKGRKDGDHIKDLCLQAYKQNSANTDDDTKPTSEGTKKYCSLTFSA